MSAGQATTGLGGASREENGLSRYLRARWDDPAWARLSAFDRPGRPVAPNGFVLIGDAADPRAPHVAMMLRARDEGQH